VGEIYSADEGGRIIVEALEGLWSGDCQECKDALLGIALRNPDPAVRIAAVQAAARDELPAETLCGLVTRTLEVPDEDLARIAVDLFTRDEPSCAEHYDAWLAEFPKKAKAGTLPSAWLDGAMNIIDGEHGAKHAAVVRKMAKELQAMVGEDHELRGAIDELASPS
jgi:hypothetical protein